LDLRLFAGAEHARSRRRRGQGAPIKLALKNHVPSERILLERVTQATHVPPKLANAVTRLQIAQNDATLATQNANRERQLLAKSATSRSDYRAAVLRETVANAQATLTAAQAALTRAP
jgi:hypothetical protein